MTMTESQQTPWMRLGEMAAYSKRGKRFLASEIRAGRLRAVRIGGRGEYMGRATWLDQWLEDLAVPVTVRRAR
jgi:hypothetical protein